MSRRIAHLDMDAFFASVELLRYPELRGLPVVIGGRGNLPRQDAQGRRQFARLRTYVGRGVVTTSTYEARELGVFSAMPMMKAAVLAPDAILLPGDFARYKAVSRQFKAAVARVSPAVEDRGIDEIYIDLSLHEQTSEELAKRLQEAVYQSCGLTCSIGIAANKLLAKMVSEFNKPNGIFILNTADIPEKIWPLSVTKVHGIGPKASQRLKNLNIITIRDLAQASPALLQQHFGLRYAQWLLAAAHGKDERPVVTHSNPKSISRETTFERDLHVVHDKALLSNIFLRLCEQLQGDLERKSSCAHTVGIKLRFDDFQIVTRDQTVSSPLVHAADIHQLAGQCLKRVRFDRRIRLFGIRLGKLSHRKAYQPLLSDLFDLDEGRK